MTKLASYPSLQGRRVFVTGGGTGIGEAIVKAFVEQGAVVAFVDIAKEASETLCAKLATARHVETIPTPHNHLAMENMWRPW